MVRIGKGAKSPMATKKSIASKKASKKLDSSESTRCFYLNDISLWETSLRRDREYRWGEHTLDKCHTQTFRIVEPEILEVEVEGEKQKQTMLRALVRLGVRMVPTEKENSDPIFTLETTFCADYFVLTPPTEDAFQEFVDFNCIHNVWPFWRQHVFDTLKTASLPVPSVPLFAGQSKYRRKRVSISRVLAASDTSEQS